MSLFNKIKSVFNSSSDDVPDAQTIYFKNGEMYKVYPTDKESWYDARYLVSDGVKYDLENLDDLKRIPATSKYNGGIWRYWKFRLCFKDESRKLL